MKRFPAIFLFCSIVAAHFQTAHGQMPSVDDLTLASSSGDARAQAVLGQYYYDGYSVPEDPNKARELFSKSATSGHPLGLLWLGRITEWGQCGITKDATKAQELYKQALVAGAAQMAESGDIFLLDLYGDAICFGDGGTTKNVPAGLAMREKAAELGNAKAAEDIAYRYFNSPIVAPDMGKARKWAKVASAAGLPNGKALHSYLSWDEAAAKAKADSQKVETLVFKGLYLGMPIADSCQILNHRLQDPTGVSVTTENGQKSIKLSQTMLGFPTGKHVEILADTSGNVSSILLSKLVLDILFDSKDMPQKEFLQTFINAYDITELESEMKELKAGFLGATSTIGFQQVYTYRSPKGFELTFFGEPRLENEGDAMQARMLGMADYGEAGSMLLKKIATANARESKFD